MKQGKASLLRQKQHGNERKQKQRIMEQAHNG